MIVNFATANWPLALPFAAVGLPLSVVGAVMQKRRIVARLRGELVEAEVVARVHIRIDPARTDIAYDDTIGSMFVFAGLLLLAGTFMTLLALGIVFG